MSRNSHPDSWKEYDTRMRKAVDEKIKQMEKAGMNTSGNLANKITTKLNIGATKESTIVGAGRKLSNEMNEVLGENAVSYTNTTNPFFASSISFNSNEIEGLLTKIIKFFMRLFGIESSSAKMQDQNGEITLDRNKEYQIVGINKNMHSMAVMVDNVNKLVVGYDPNGNFNPSCFYSLLPEEDRAYLQMNGYTFVNANSENKNKGTVTGMCGVLTTDWIEQELKTRLDERKRGITKYNSMQEIRDHYTIVNQRNNPDVERMMARNRVHFLMSKGENIETLKEYSTKNTINISNNQEHNLPNNSKKARIIIGDITEASNNVSASANITPISKTCDSTQKSI